MNKKILVRDNLKRKPYITLVDGKYVICDKDEVKRALSNVSKYGAGVISAEKHNSEETNKEEEFKRNKANSELLKEDFKNAKVGYTPAWGGYYNIDTGEHDIDERSFFVTYSPTRWNSEREFFDFMISLAKKYDQDAVLISLPHLTNGKPMYFNKYGQLDMKFDELRKSTDKDQFYTDLQKRKGGVKYQKFTADSVNIRPCFAIKVYDGFANKCKASNDGEYSLYDDIFTFNPMKVD